VVIVRHRNQAMIKTMEVEMMKLFSLRSFRLLTLGGAKASTNGKQNEPDDEGDDLFYTE
jgi:hypothetical protein